MGKIIYEEIEEHEISEESLRREYREAKDLYIKHKKNIDLDNVNTRSDALLILEEKCNTRRCYNAPHNFLVGLINKKKARILRSKKCLCNICSLGTSLSVTCGLLGQGPVFCFVQPVCT